MGGNTPHYIEKIFTKISYKIFCSFKITLYICKVKTKKIILVIAILKLFI